MRTLVFSTLLFFLLGFCSCSNDSVTNREIDKVISQYDSVNFNNIKGTSILQRSGTPNEIVYVIDRFGENKPPYFVTFNISRQSITEVNRNLLERDSMSDYLTESEIANAVHTIRKYGFYLLSVDSSENVFINPFYADEPAYLLRLKSATGDSIVRMGFVYKLYRENWYLNDNAMPKE
ncbi:MAG TPA: hypothetical protein PK339_11575 [Flavitalea sp.]|nr:hypothetical protein [Flavitalea sp.]